MNNYFSDHFKELRKSQELTQEQIAEMFGVSSQAISKWECGTSYPDIELLPIIANMFKVSTDYLLGVDVAKQENAIAELIAESETLCSNDRYHEAVTLLRNALIQYPSNCEIMYRLAWSLRGTIRENPEQETEAINIYRRILNISRDRELVCKVTRDLAYCYYTLGDLQTAQAYINRLPSFEVCREYNLGRSNVLCGNELAETLKNNIRMYAAAMKECLAYFMSENILREADILPYTRQKAAKDTEIIEGFLR